MGRVTLKGELELALLGRDEAAGSREVDRDSGGVLTWKSWRSKGWGQGTDCK